MIFDSRIEDVDECRGEFAVVVYQLAVYVEDVQAPLPLPFEATGSEVDLRRTQRHACEVVFEPVPCDLVTTLWDACEVTFLIPLVWRHCEADSSEVAVLSRSSNLSAGEALLP